MTKTTIVMLSDKGTYSADNKWALSLPQDRLDAICDALRTAALALTTETAEEFDEVTAWEMAQPQARKLALLRRKAQIIAGQIEGHVRATGQNHCTAINTIVLSVA